MSRNAVLIALLAALAVRLIQSSGWRRAPAQVAPATQLAA
jgi:hypothetical protein